MKRAKSQSVIRRNQPLLEQIEQVKTDHSLWGYRRVWSYLKKHPGISVNKKRVYRLMKEQNLLVTPKARLEAKLDSHPSKLDASDIDEILERLFFFKNNFENFGNVRAWDEVARKFDIHKRTMLRWIKTRKMSKSSYLRLDIMLRRRGKVEGHGLSESRYIRSKNELVRDTEAKRKMREAKERLGTKEVLQ